jgi:hypothetical protein
MTTQNDFNEERTETLVNQFHDLKKNKKGSVEFDNFILNIADEEDDVKQVFFANPSFEKKYNSLVNKICVDFIENIVDTVVETDDTECSMIELCRDTHPTEYLTSSEETSAETQTVFEETQQEKINATCDNDYESVTEKKTEYSFQYNDP